MERARGAATKALNVPMPSDSLLQKKGIPTGKAVCAATVALLIIGSIGYYLHTVWDEMESHFHIFHPNAEDIQVMRKHPLELLKLVVQFPLLSILGMALVLPLGPYVTEHEAFQNLNPLLPHHYVKLVTKVYSAWSNASGGKLAGKDL